QLEEPSNSVFYKNTYEVIPNPSMIFGEALPVIYFYSEIYNVAKDVQSEVLMIEHLLLSSLNKPYYKKVKYIPRKNNSIVEVAAINISKIPSGSYTLVLSVSDTLKNLRVTSSKRVFIYNPNVLDTALSKFSEIDVLSSEFSVMTEDELNETYQISKYLASNEENEQWKKINTIDAKRNFLFKFWKMRDPDQLSPINEAKLEYFRRVEITNAQFSNVQRRGWKTDRGRIYLLYGEPSEIERYPNQVDAKPYEIWKYNNLEGGVIFVFADLTGFADYTLLHSTLRGELRDDNWMRKINVR
ncbi:MAG: GWxTD domain-containing protein, partial [Ignavibacteria bacterium]|nr:GWxTD domain-containing protein [Ignavibacteria bacterium]